MTTNITEIYTCQLKFDLTSERYDEQVLRTKCELEIASRDLAMVEDLLREKELAYIRSIKILSEKKKSLEDEIKTNKKCLPPEEILKVQEMLNSGLTVYQIALHKEELFSFGVNEVDFTTMQTLLKGIDSYTGGFQSKSTIWWEWTDIIMNSDPSSLYRRFIHDATSDDGDFNVITEPDFLGDETECIDTLIVDDFTPDDDYVTSYTKLWIRKFTKA